MVLANFQKYTHAMQDHRTIREMKPMSFKDFKIAMKTKSRFRSRKKVMNHYIKKSLLNDHEISSNEYQKFFKFTIVRNPYARLFSWFNNLMQKENREKYNVPADYTFERFVKDGMRTDIRILQGCWKARGNERYKDSTFAYYNPVLPQVHWIRDWRGKVPLDYIGRFEKLHEEWKFICKKLKIKDPKFDWAMRSKVSGDAYKKEYDDEMRKIVADFYKEDLEFFDYDFE